jgi:thioredoxin-related protein
MRSFFFLAVFFASFINYNGWENDLDKAKKKAHAEHKLILLEFSGSDWCVPCIRLRKDIFETTSFSGFADSALVLLNADFPRLKKNQLSKEQQKKNDKLAEIYNPDGVFPITLLLDAEGKVLKTWEGYPNLSAEQFIAEVKASVHAAN